MKTLTVEGWRPSAIGRQGPSANVGGCRDRATAPIEDIGCEKNPWLQLQAKQQVRLISRLLLTSRL
jgi:hypothetical protein